MGSNNEEFIPTVIEEECSVFVAWQIADQDMDLTDPLSPCVVPGSKNRLLHLDANFYRLENLKFSFFKVMKNNSLYLEEYSEETYAFITSLMEKMIASFWVRVNPINQRKLKKAIRNFINSWRTKKL